MAGLFNVGDGFIGVGASAAAGWPDGVPIDDSWPNTPPPSVVKACDCGGWTVGTHSGWCSNPKDNVKRKKGLSAT